MSTLLLFNPKDVPYGNLSPLADHIVSKSYASLIKSKLLQEKVGKMRSNEARDESLKNFKQIHDEKFKKFVKQALEVKYKKGSIVLKNLLDVRQDRIAYVSKNSLLGTNEGVGDNFVGECLYTIRKQERERIVLQEKKDVQDYTNKVYSVYTLLRDEIQSGRSNLKSYTGKRDIDEIINQRISEGSHVDIIDVMHSKEDVPDFFFKVPESIPAVLQCLYHTHYNEKCETIKKEEILAFYIYQLSKKCKFESEMKQQFLIKLEANGQIDSLVKRLIKYYELGLLKEFTGYTCSPLNESDLDKDLFASFTRDVKKDKAVITGSYETMSPRKSKKKPVLEQNLLGQILKTLKTTGPLAPIDTIKHHEPTVFYFNDDSIHSPYYYTPDLSMMYIIGAFSYPSLIHYAYSKMFELFGEIKDKKYVLYNQFEAYKMIQKEISEKVFIFCDFSEMKDTYHRLKDEYVTTNVQKIFNELTRLKYAPLYTIDGKLGIPSKNVILLLSTLKEYSTLSFKDTEDVILGQGFAGSILTDICKELYTIYGKIDFETLEKSKKLKTMIDVLKDEDIRLFSIKRVKDLYEMMKRFKDTFLLSVDPHTLKKNYYTDLEAFNFIFKNFLDCIVKRVRFDKFDKSLIPSDFKAEMHFNVSVDCLEELWKYTFYIYSVTKQLKSIQFIVAKAYQTSECYYEQMV